MSKFLLLTTTSFALLFISCSINNTTEYFYTVTVKSGSHGTVCNAGDYQCRPQDALVIKVCSVEDGYKFKEWKLDSIKSASNCLISDPFNDTATISQIRERVVIYPEFVNKQIVDTLPPHVLCVKTDSLEIGIKNGTRGRSWINPFYNIHEALAAAHSGDSIWVTAGNYFVDSKDPSVSYTIPDGISIFGGFIGTESVLSERDWVNNRTVLNGKCGTDRSDTIFVAHKNTTIDGFRITGGGRYGGYIKGNCKIRNCIFEKNSEFSPAGGTALMLMYSSCEVSGCVFTGNYGTTGSAVLLYSDLENITIANCVIADNRGPAIYNNAKDVTIMMSSVVYNKSPGSGPAGIYNTGTVRLESSILWGNSNKGNLINTQIDATQYVSYCCIQDCFDGNKGVGSKVEGLWQETNIDKDPYFETITIPVDDRNWYFNTDNITPPFVPSHISGCVNASRLSVGTLKNDIRGIPRHVPFEIGAYERYK